MKKQTRRTITIAILGGLGALLFGFFAGKCMTVEEEAYSRFIQEHIEMRENGRREALGY